MKSALAQKLQTSSQAWIAAGRQHWKAISIATTSLAALALLAIIAGSFAQPIKEHTFSPREVLTTARDIKFRSTRELAVNYSPESGVTEGNVINVIVEDILDPAKARPNTPKEDQVAEADGIKAKAGKYRRGTITYPAGSPVRILKSIKTKVGTKHVILIGETREQGIVGDEAIIETGGTAGPKVEIYSIQKPKLISSAQWTFPKGAVYTGIAVGDEDVESDRIAEQEIFRIVNEIRVAHGLKALVWDEDLARAARYQAADRFVQNYSASDHRSLDLSCDRSGNLGQTYGDPGVFESAEERIKRFMPVPRGGGENAASAFHGPKEAVDKWMTSPRHRANLLNPRWVKTGIGAQTNHPSGVGSTQVQVFSE